MVTRITGCLLLLALCTAVVFPFSAAQAASGLDEAAEQARTYLLELERKQGTLSPWSYVALAASGEPLNATRVSRAVERLESEETTACCLLILTLLASGQDPYNFRGRNLVARLQAAQLPGGKFSDHLQEGGERLVNAHVWAVLALKAAAAPIPDPEAARRWLAGQQHEDGSFYWDARERKTSDVDTTGMALMALAALGETPDSPVVQKAVRYLKSVQLSGGGFESWGAENAESCSAAILGLVAAGLDPRGPDFQKPGGDPVTALLRFQLPGGAFEHVKGGGPNEMATQQALLALTAVRWPEAFRTWPLGPSAAAQGPFEARFWVGRNYYSVRQNGREERYEIDATPFVQNGRTFVPVRYLALALGVPEAGIVYEPAAGKVTLRKGDTTVTLSVGSPVIYVNDRARSMDVAPLVRSGRTYLPARYVAEALGYRAEWEASRGEVLITPR